MKMYCRMVNIRGGYIFYYIRDVLMEREFNPPQNIAKLFMYTQNINLSYT